MNLHDPSRPRIGLRPAFLDGMCIIPKLELFPLETGGVEITAFIPIQGENLNTAKRYRVSVKTQAVVDLLYKFNDNPEETLKLLFGDDPIPPKLEPNLIRSRKPKPNILAEMDQLILGFNPNEGEI